MANIRIDELTPTILPSGAHEFAAMKDGLTVKLTVDQVIQLTKSAILDGSPEALNTLNELAAALGDDADFATTVTNSISEKLALTGGTMSGNLDMGGNEIQDAVFKQGLSTLLKIHQIGMHNDANSYSTSSVTDAGSGPFVSAITPSNSNTKLLVWVKGEMESVRVGSGNHGVHCGLGYYNGSTYVAKSAYNSALFANVTVTGTSTRRTPYSHFMELTQAEIRSDVNEWLPRILFGAIYSGQTVRVYNTEFLFMEVE